MPEWVAAVLVVSVLTLCVLLGRWSNGVIARQVKNREDVDVVDEERWLTNYGYGGTYERGGKLHPGEGGSYLAEPEAVLPSAESATMSKWRTGRKVGRTPR